MSEKVIAYTDIEDSIDTSSSYRGSLIIRNDSILVPMISLGIIEHILNPTERLVYFDFSYLFFKSFSKLLLNSFTDFKSHDVDKRYCYIGGNELGDLEVECKQAYLLLPTNSRASSTLWYADTKPPYYKANLDLEQVNNFWATVNPVWDMVDSLS